jgi:hypothetical protein
MDNLQTTFETKHNIMINVVTNYDKILTIIRKNWPWIKFNIICDSNANQAKLSSFYLRFNLALKVCLYKT